MCDTARDFDGLPVDIKLLIFSYFSTVELSKNLTPVCREWRTFCKHPSLWKSLELNISTKRRINLCRHVLLRCRNSLTSLKILAKTPLSAFFTIFRNAKPRTLKHLDLTLRENINLDESDMLTIVSNCPDIQVLRLFVRTGGVTLQCVRHIVTLSNLKSLIASFKHPEARECLELIAKHCSKIEALDIRVRNRNYDDFVVMLADLRKDQLKHLLLSGTGLSHEAITAIASCRKISSLKIGVQTFFHGYITDEDVKILSGLPRLEWLSLHETDMADPHVWVRFFSCPNMSSLRIIELNYSQIDDNGLDRLASTCGDLIILSLAYCEKFRESGIQAVVDKCSELIYLDISRTNVNGDVLVDIPQKLPKLTGLNLFECCFIREKDVETFTGNCPRVKVTPPMKVLADVSIRNLDLVYRVDDRLKIEWTEGNTWYVDYYEVDDDD